MWIFPVAIAVVCIMFAAAIFLAAMIVGIVRDGWRGSLPSGETAQLLLLNGTLFAGAIAAAIVYVDCLRTMLAQG